MTAPDRVVVWLREAMDAAWRDAEAATSGPWHVTEYVAGSDYGFDAGVGTAPGEVDVVGHGYEGGGCERVQDARHIVRHNPHAVLRRIAADRELLDWGNWPGGGPDSRDAYEWAVRLLAEGWGWTEETT
ncbi:MAG: hypothetical protein HOY76_21445 [Streptomyces sp.]|nr:hypothetical protein [Streptomyces sp.]